MWREKREVTLQWRLSNSATVIFSLSPLYLHASVSLNESLTASSPKPPLLLLHHLHLLHSLSLGGIFSTNRRQYHSPFPPSSDQLKLMNSYPNGKESSSQSIPASFFSTLLSSPTNLAAVNSFSSVTNLKGS